MSVQDLLALLRSVPQRPQFLRGAAVAGTIVLITLIILYRIAAQPPLRVFEDARVSVSAARHAEAHRYAPALLQLAEQRWQQAQQEWHRQNQKWQPVREFHSAAESARVATTEARRARRLALAVRDSLRWLSATGITLVKDKIDSFRQHLEDMPVSLELRRKIMASELAVRESELAFQRHDYLQAVARYQWAASQIGSAGDEAVHSLRAYLSHLPEWRRWAAETITWSQQQENVAVVVDKMAAVVQVYHAGELLAEYAIELGPRWLGHKRQKGDGATPEGRYHVTKKKEGSKTSYFKALEINYPNEDDIARFQAAKARGEIPASAHIGGLIEIHGAGGKGANWTAGCVALRNDDMDEIYSLVEVGTPVTIVGSLRGVASSLSASNGAARTPRPAGTKP